MPILSWLSDGGISIQEQKSDNSSVLVLIEVENEVWANSYNVIISY
jgi:hypothetical protein